MIPTGKSKNQESVG